MKPFDYIAARSIEEACAVLDTYGSDARILAGGTDLLIELRRPKTPAPKVVLDISGINELHSIKSLNGTVTIKPLTVHASLAASPELQRDAHLLSMAALTIGSPQIRNRGTIGGNIMNAATCADTVPPLVALGASVTVCSRRGTRTIGMDELFPAPYRTALEPDEFLLDVQFPALPGHFRGTFVKLGRRNALSISRLSMAAIIAQDSHGTITEARIVPGAATPTWQRILEAEQILLGAKPTEKLFAAAGKAVSAAMIAQTGRRWSTEYKEPVIAVLAQRAIAQCCSDGQSVKAPSKARSTAGAVQ